MSHVHRVSAGQADWRNVPEDTVNTWLPGSAPVLADAKSDFLNGIYRAWNDYVYAKKNEPLG